MKLFGSQGSPFAHKARLALEEKHVEYEYVPVTPNVREELVGPFNPLGKIPVLLRDDGKAVYDSPLIVEYVDGLVAEPKLIPADFEDRIEVKRWEALCDGIAEATVLLNHDARKAPERREKEAWYEKQRQKIGRGLAAMEHDLGGREFCFGSTFTLADIACGYALVYLDKGLPDFQWRSAHPNLSRHANKLDARASFRKTDPRTG